MKNRDKLRMLKGKTEVTISKMADNVVSIANLHDKSFANNCFTFLCGACRIYKFMIDTYVNDYEMAVHAIKNSCSRHGIDFDEIANYIW